MANQYRSVLASSGPAPTGGDAVAANVLTGKTFTNDNGFDTGTMPNRGAVSQTLNAGESYTIPEGYHNGSGVVTASGLTFTNIGTTSPTSPITAKYVFVTFGKGSTGAGASIDSGTYAHKYDLTDGGSTQYSFGGFILEDAVNVVLTGVNQLSVAIMN